MTVPDEVPGGREPAPPTEGRWWPVVPLLALLATTAVALVLGLQVAPKTVAVAPWIGEYAGYAEVHKARFNSQALVWAGLGATAVLSVTCMLLAGWGVVWACVSGALGRAALVMVSVVFGVAVLAGDLFGAADISAPLAGLHGKGFVVWPLRAFTLPVNGLTAAGIAALFAAASAIIVRARKDPSAMDALVRHLHILLALGAVGTVVGVLEIGALHRLPAAAARGTAQWEALRPQMESGLISNLDKALTAAPADGPQEAPLVQNWVQQHFKLQDGPAKALAADLAKRAKADPELREQICRAAAAGWLAEMDELSRKEVAAALESYAAHVASFWGVVFTTTLAMVYLPTAAVLVRLSPSQGTAQALALGISSTPGSRWDTLVRPFLRLLATLAPLLVGTLADLLRSASQVAGGG